MEKKKLFTATFTFEGKRYYVRSSKSQREADKKAALKQSALEKGSVILHDGITVEQYAMKWVEIYKANTVSQGVYKHYISYIKNYIVPAIGYIPIQKIRQINLQAILNAQQGKSKNHCVKLRATIEQIFTQAFKDQLISRNTADGLILPQATDGTHRSITQAERAAILSAAKTHKAGLWVKLMLYCGLRPQETAMLTWGSIDQVNKRLMIRLAIDENGEAKAPKSTAGIRDIPIPPLLWNELQARLKATNGQASDYIITDTYGHRLTKTSMKHLWNSFKKEVDIALGAKLLLDENGNLVKRYGKVIIIKSAVSEDLKPYCLRHTFCTDLEAAGVPINVAKYLMGHSSIELTSRIYSHIRGDILNEAGAKMAVFGATAGATPNETKGDIIKLNEIPAHKRPANDTVTKKKA